MRFRNVIVIGGVLISLGLSACTSSNDNVSPAQSVSPSVVRTKTETPTVTHSPSEDVSGNCDEPEHTSDAMCQAPGSGKSRSGSGEDNGGGGSNSGPGF